MGTTSAIRAFLTGLLLTFISSACVSYGQSQLVYEWDIEKDQLMAETRDLPLDEIILQLDSDDSFDRLSAYYVLEEMGPEEVIPSMIEILARHLARGRYYYRDLANSWGADAVPVLIEILENSYLVSGSDTAFSGWCSIDGLTAIGPEARDAVPLLIEKHYEATNPFAQLSDPFAALASIEETSGETARIFCKALNKDEFLYIKNYICFAIGDLAEPDDSEVIEQLIEFRDKTNSNPNVTLWDDIIAVRYALYQVGWEQEENFEFMEDIATGRTQVTVPHHIWTYIALVKIGDERSFEILNAVFSVASGPISIFVSDELVRKGPTPEVIDLLIGMLENPMVQWSAVHILNRFGPDAIEALPELQKLYREVSSRENNESDLYLLSELEEAIIRISEGTEWTRTPG